LRAALAAAPGVAPLGALDHPADQHRDDQEGDEAADQRPIHERNDIRVKRVKRSARTVWGTSRRPEGSAPGGRRTASAEEVAALQVARGGSSRTAGHRRPHINNSRERSSPRSSPSRSVCIRSPCPFALSLYFGLAPTTRAIKAPSTDPCNHDSRKTQQLCNIFEFRQSAGISAVASGNCDILRSFGERWMTRPPAPRR
jgi:hypothetical protein